MNKKHFKQAFIDKDIPTGCKVTQLINDKKCISDFQDYINFFKKSNAEFNQNKYVLIVRFLIARIALKANRPGVASKITVREFLFAQECQGRWNFQVIIFIWE